MSKRDDNSSSKLIQTYSGVINALLKLSFDRFDLSSFPHLLSNELNVAKSINPDFVSFLAAVGRSWTSINGDKTGPLGRDSELRQQRIQELLPHLETFCKKLGLDVNIALIGLRLRQGDFFILEDKAEYLKVLLPTPRVMRSAMALSGILTLPISFNRKFGEYPANFTDVLSFESASENLCSILKINPIVPRLAALDEEALNMVESKFGFSRKAVFPFVIDSFYSWLGSL